MKKKPAYLILDLETTGLDPTCNYILEVGAILVDAELREIDRYQSVIRHGTDYSEYSQVVQDMHYENGLWSETSVSPYTVRDVQAELVEWLLRHEADGVQLAGASVHFDRSFLAADMPEVLALLHYRQVDITGVARELRVCGIEIPEVPRAGHRAMSDCVAELEEWRATRGALALLRRGAVATYAPSAQLEHLTEPFTPGEAAAVLDALQQSYIDAEAQRA